MLAGAVGVLLGDEVVSGAPGDLIFKPRGLRPGAGDGNHRASRVTAP